MTTRICLAIALAAGTVVTASIVDRRPTITTRQEPSIAREESPIESLDRCIQKRMHEHTGFGMARLADDLIQLRKFESESPAEVEALADLQASGRTVGLHLGGRGLLSKGSADDSDVSPPIAVTGAKLPDDRPQARELREFGRKALVASEEGRDGLATGSVGRWSVEARVIRADRASCLGCHTGESANAFPSLARGIQRPLKIGDALGVAIYVYAGDRP